MRNFRFNSMIAQQDVYGPPPEENSFISRDYMSITQTDYGVKTPEKKGAETDNNAQIMSIILTALITITVFIMGIIAVFNHKLSTKAKTITIGTIILIGIIAIVIIKVLL